MKKTIEHSKEDGLDKYVERINKAVNYKGSDAHEDVRSILKERDRIARQEREAELRIAINGLEEAGGWSHGDTGRIKSLTTPLTEKDV